MPVTDTSVRVSVMNRDELVKMFHFGYLLQEKPSVVLSCTHWSYSAAATVQLLGLYPHATAVLLPQFAFTADIPAET